jgi:competence protein ComEC
MKGTLVFCSVSALLGIITATEGKWFVCLFLLYIFLLWYVKRMTFTFILLISIAYLGYFFLGNSTVHHNETSLSSLKTEFQVQFTDKIKIDGDRLRAIVKDTSTKETLILTYRIPSQIEQEQLQQTPFMKRICYISGKLNVPDTARNENSFNYQDYLKKDHIYWELHVTEWKKGSCAGGKLTFIDRIKNWRIQGISLIEKNFSKESAPIAAALIFGTRELLSEELISSYQKLGVIHLISISGLHVALLVGMIFYLGIRMGVVREKLSWTLITILPLYVFLTGASPSVNRSVMMTVIILLIKQIKFVKKVRAIDGLCLSFLILTFWNPFIIYNIGFQLSYTVTFSLLLCIPIVERNPSLFWKMVITSYISQVSSLPLLIYHFYEIPLISIAANLVFIPLYSFIFLPGLIFLFIVQFFSVDIFQLLSFFLSLLIDYSNRIATTISLFSWTRAIPGKPTVPLIIAYSCSIFLAFYLWEKGKPLIFALSLPWLVLCADMFLPNVSPSGEVSIIDVGQGDSILINLPFNRGNYLIDTGGTISFSNEKWTRKKHTFEVGEDVLVPYLKSKGVDKLDLLILTHGDMDHIGGSLALLKEIKVEKIVLPSVATEKSFIEEELVNLARKQNIKISYVVEGSSWKVKNAEFFILAPSTNYFGGKNDGSIVILAKIGRVSWLFTGDLGKEEEYKLIEKYPNLTVDILKVGHHGSKNSTSDEFIRHLRPKYSIISVGKKNSFGHPHSEVIKILEASGSTILRTDLHGGITLKFNGKGSTFYKEIP